MKFRLPKTILAMLGVGLACSAHAAVITKATTGSALSDGVSWVGGFAPTLDDVATWDSATSLGGALTMATAQSWGGIEIQNATADLSISGAGALTLGTSGITIADAAKNLTFTNSVIFSGATSNVNVGTGRTLFLNGVKTFNAGTTTTLNGAGTVEIGASQNSTGAGDVVLNSGTLFMNMQGGTHNRTGSTTINGGIVKSLTSLNFFGSGTVYLNGGAIGSASTMARTFDNALVIGGDFRVGGAGLDTGAITFSGTADLSGGNRTITTNVATTFSGVISNGGIIKNGTGTLTLSGNNTYTGPTIVNAGTLSLTGSLNSLSALQVGGGTFSYARAGAQSLNGLTVNSGSSVVTNTNTGTTNTLDVGAITRNAGGVVNFASASATGNVVTTTTANTNGIIGAWATVGQDWAANDGTGKIVAYTGYTDIQRLNPGSIADGAAGNVRIIEGTGTAGNITLGATDTTINTLLQSASGGTGASTIDVAGKTLRTGGVLVASTAGALTIGTSASSGILSAASAGGELILRNNSTITGGTLTINSVIADNTSASSLTIAGSGAGSGIVTLAGSNTYSGGTTLVGTGYLVLTSNNALGTGGVTFNNSDVFRLTSNGSGRTLANAITLSGNGVVRIGGGSGGNYTFTGPVSLAGGTRTIDAAVSVSISGIVSDGGAAPGGIVKQGSSTLTLSGINTYTGGTTVNAGELQISAADVAGAKTGLGTGAVTVNSGATLRFSTGSHSNAHSYANAINLNGGTLISNDGVVTYSGPIALTGNNTVNVVWANKNATFSGAVTGTGSLTKTGDGTLFLSNNTTYGGNISVNAGTLNLGGSTQNFGAVTFGGGTVSNGTLNGSSYAATAGTVNANFGGSGTLTKTTTGILLLAGTNNMFNGLIDLQAGDVVLNNEGSENGGASVQLTGGRFILSNPFVGKVATIGNLSGTGGEITTLYNSNNGIRSLGVTQTVDSTYAGTLTGETTASSRHLALIKGGSANLTLSGANTYVGGTTINAGTLTAGSLSAFGGGAITVNAGTLNMNGNAITNAITLAGGTLGNSGSVVTRAGAVALTAASSIGGSGNLTLGGNITGAFGLTKVGTGSVTLNGASNAASGITVTAGTLTAGNATALGNGTVTVNGGTLNLNGQALGNKIVLAGGSLIGASAYTGTMGGTTTSFDTGTVAGKEYKVDATTGLSIASLSGQGTFTGGLVTVSGVHDVGNSPGQQSFTGSGLTYADGSTLNLEFDNLIASTGVAGTNWDVINVTGTLSIGTGVSLTWSSYDLVNAVDYTGIAWDTSFTKTLIQAGTISGSFDLPSDIVIDGQGQWTLAQTGNNVTATWTANAIPEPSSLGLLGVGMAGMLLRRRRKQA